MNPSENDQVWNEALEKLRRGAGISIDPRGEWWHEGERFEHPRLIQQLNRGLDWKPQTDTSSEDHQASSLPASCFAEWSGDATVRLGDHWCYVHSDLTPFIVLKIGEDLHNHQLIITLNNGETWPIGLLSIKEDIVFCRPSRHRLARFSPHAQLQCAAWLTEDCEGLWLEYAGHRWPINCSSL